MIKYTFLLLTTLLSFAAIADDETEYCTGVSTLAGSIMEMRQDGVAMSELYEVLAGSTGSLQMVKLAYQYPMYETREYKIKEVARFKDQLFMLCID
jgi:hypothetical protein